MPKVYIIDIDGTICRTPKNDLGEHDYAKSVPIEKRIQRINSLYDAGATIIYWTARGSASGKNWYGLTKTQLDTWGCKYHGFDIGKPSYDYWIDDKAFNDNQFFEEF